MISAKAVTYCSMLALKFDKSKEQQKPLYSKTEEDSHAILSKSILSHGDSHRSATCCISNSLLCVMATPSLPQQRQISHLIGLQWLKVRGTEVRTTPMLDVHRQLMLGEKCT